LTHLKIQKLAFYSYGSILAADMEHQLSNEIFEFQAWDHGPVNAELYNRFRAYGAKPIAEFPQPGSPPQAVAEILKDVVSIYGAFNAWSLRQQSHQERPWIDAHARGKGIIPTAEIKAHFKRKFMSGSVMAPDYLFGLGSFRIDGIPIQNYPNLKSLASAVQRVVKDFK